MNLLAIACLSASLAQQQMRIPYIRFTGRLGYYKDFDLIRKDLSKLPPLLPREPQIMQDGSMVVTDGINAVAIFDPTYTPIRMLILKRQVLELLMAKGPNATFLISELPEPLKTKVITIVEGFHHTKGGTKYYFRREPDFRVGFLTEISTSIDSPNQDKKFKFDQNPVASSSEENALKESDLQKHKALRSLYPKGEPGLGKFNGWTGEVNLYVEDRAQYGSQIAVERKMLELFDHWLIKEHINLDTKFVNYLELNSLLNPLAKVTRSKTFGEFGQASPDGYSKILKDFSNNKNSDSYTSADELRIDLKSSRIKCSGNIYFQFAAEGKSEIVKITISQGTTNK